MCKVWGATIDPGPGFEILVLTRGRYSQRPDHDRLSGVRGLIRLWDDRDTALAEAQAYARQEGFNPLDVRVHYWEE